VSTRDIKTHAEWCQHLRRLGILNKAHLYCAFNSWCVAQDEEDD